MPKRGELSEREMRFVMEYLEDQNATRAYEAAGYPVTSYANSRNAASKLMTKGYILDAISREKEKIMKELHITKGRVLREIAKLAFTDMTEVVRWTESGTHYTNSDDLPKRVTGAIKEVTETITNNGHTINFKMHDKAKALATLVERFGIGQDNDVGLELYEPIESLKPDEDLKDV